MTSAWTGGRPWRRMVALTLATYGTTCHLCGGPGATTADHVVPRARGGTDALSNLRPAHRSCNCARHDLPLPMWFARHPTAARRATVPASRKW